MLYFLKNLEEGNRFHDEALLYLALDYGLADDRAAVDSTSALAEKGFSAVFQS